jgi:hypothetical protein
MPRQLDQAEHAEREGGTHREREFIHAQEDTRPEGEGFENAVRGVAKKSPSATAGLACPGRIQLFLKTG